MIHEPGYWGHLPKNIASYQNGCLFRGTEKVGVGDHHSGGEVKSVQLYFLNGFLYMQ